MQHRGAAPTERRPPGWPSETAFLGDDNPSLEKTSLCYKRGMLIDALQPALGSFRDRVIVVTGASSGIGRETARLFGRLGARVALVARRRKLLGEVAGEVEAAGGRAMVVPADVGVARAARTAVARVRRSWRRVDVLVNNAGILLPARVATLKPADLETMLRVNLFGALHMTQAALPGMLRRPGGSIVNVASLAGRRGVMELGGYCATKFALVGLTEALRTEVPPASLHIGLVLPGVVETPMVRAVDNVDTFSAWPAQLNMPAEWVAAAIALSVRFGLREVSVPPGAATIEELGALVPGVTDTLIGWGRAALSMVAGATRTARPPR
jgi:NAD(P)-dependent dehydrogenase (short-subunit alcohol dehydrogenase family)